MSLAQLLMLCGLIALVPACGGGNGFSPPTVTTVSAVAVGNSLAGPSVGIVNSPTNDSYVGIEFSTSGTPGATVTVTLKYYIDANANNMQDAGETAMTMTEAPSGLIADLKANFLGNPMSLPTTTDAGSVLIPAGGTVDNGLFFWDAAMDLGGFGAKYGVLVCVDAPNSGQSIAPGSAASPNQFFVATSSATGLAGTITAPSGSGSGRSEHTANSVSGLDGMASPTDMGAEILIAGGRDTAGDLNAIDRFSVDVTNGTLATGANLTSANVRREHSSATFMDPTTGTNLRVLVTGGNVGGMASNTADVYSFGPMGGEMVTPTATTMGAARKGHASVWLPSNKILIVGGTDTSGTPLSSAEMYDPANPGSPFSTLSGVPAGFVGRSGHTMTLLPNGHVLIAGGMGPGGTPVDAYTYDPVGNSWAVAASNGAGPMIDRTGHTATLLVNGVVALTGGYNQMGAALDTVDFYRPFAVTDAATSLNIPAGFTNPNQRNGPDEIVPAMPVKPTTARARHSASRLGDGRLLIVGGFSANGSGELATSEFFTPFAVHDNAIGLFTLTNPSGSANLDLANARANHTSTTLQGDGSVVVVGGEDVTGPLDSVEVFRFSNTRPTASNVTVAGTGGGNLTISFDLNDAENDRAFVIVRYRVGSGAFKFATLNDYANTVNLGTPSTGNTLTWTSGADGINSGDTVTVEVIPVGGSLGIPVSSAATTLN